VASALAERLDVIRDNGGLSAREVAQLLNTTPQTVSRWQTGKATPHPGNLERLLLLEWLARQLGQFYSADRARLWLFSPHRLLDGERPADRIAKDQIDDVLALLDQMQSAAFT
jgi:transcriptional regulator with XRE-family HTH domain